jgi:hypothetical protein
MAPCCVELAALLRYMKLDGIAVHAGAGALEGLARRRSYEVTLAPNIISDGHTSPPQIEGVR